MRVSAYAAKKALLTPRTVRRRRRLTDIDPLARSMLELHYYSPSMYEFMRATALNPDILVEADLSPDSVVLDIGAYVGEWSEQIADRYGARIYAFEPAPGPSRKLRRRLAGRPNVRTFEFGLGAVDATVTFALDGPGSAASQHPGAFGRADVTIRDVDAVLEELALTEIDLCKVNIEGGEFDLFDRLIDTGRMGSIRDVSVQFHEWHPHAYRRRRRIRRALALTHEEQWNYPWVWEYWRRRDR